MSKLAWRRTWFQVHKWIGLILAILIIPICITGSALVWHDALDEAVNPQRYATTGATSVDPTAYVAAAGTALKPGDRIASLRMGEEPGAPVTVTAVAAGAGKGPPQRTNVWLDPPSARVLDSAGANSGLVRVMHAIHGSLMVPGWGRSIVGWIGVAMMLSAFTGLWLWWPTVGSVKRAFRWRRHPNFDNNLHHQFGFWIALPLFVLSLTGAWISFPAFFGNLVGQAPQRGPGGMDRAAMMRARPLEAPTVGLDRALAAARAAAPGEVRQVTWPTDRKAEWSFTLKAKGPPATVAVDAETGAAKLTPPANRNQNGVARLMRRIHDGTDMGLVWQVIIFLGGLLPAALAVTGVTMWWRARGWKAELAARQAAAKASRVNPAL